MLAASVSVPVPLESMVPPIEISLASVLFVVVIFIDREPAEVSRQTDRVRRRDLNAVARTIAVHVDYQRPRNNPVKRSGVVRRITIIVNLVCAKASARSSLWL